jgi:myosin protein heavy chain
MEVLNYVLCSVMQASKLIASVYYSKIEADAVDDAANNARQTCSEFVYDFMLNLYGLKGIAESAIHGLFKTLKTLITSKQMEKQHKVRYPAT